MKFPSTLSFVALLVACTKAPAPAPTPSPLTVASMAPRASALAPADAGSAMVLDAAAALAERPATTLAELWTKRLATAYVAHDLLLERVATQHLEHALRYASLDEELAALRALQAIAPVFEDTVFSYNSYGPKGPVPEGKWAEITAAQDAKRAPLYAALYRKVGPAGRFHLAVYHHQRDDSLLKAMLAVTAEDHVCPLPLTKGMSGFDRYSEAIATLKCPTDARPMAADPYWSDDPKAYAGDGEPLTRCLEAVAKARTPSKLPREAWFAEYRPMRMRDACVGLAAELAKDKSKREVLVAAFAGTDIETRARLLSVMSSAGVKLAAGDIESLAADRRTRLDIRRALKEEKRLRDFPTAHATTAELNEATLVDWVREFFGSVPDEITPLAPMKRAKDGKPAQIAFYRFRALAPNDNAGIGSFDFAIGEETGTNWDPEPDALRSYLEEHIHDDRSVSLFNNDR